MNEQREAIIETKLQRASANERHTSTNLNRPLMSARPAAVTSLVDLSFHTKNGRDASGIAYNTDERWDYKRQN